MKITRRFFYIFGIIGSICGMTIILRNGGCFGIVPFIASMCLNLILSEGFYRLAKWLFRNDR